MIAFLADQWVWFSWQLASEALCL